MSDGPGGPSEPGTATPGAADAAAEVEVSDGASPLHRWRRTLFLFLGAFLVASAGAVYWIDRQRSWAPFREGELALPGLVSTVEVLRDSLGVPHLFADEPFDLYYAQGFVHASDRLWQLELLRRVGSGTLSEVLGEPALATDRWLRTVGFHRAAERKLAALDDPWPMATLDAYARGVNAAVEAWEGPWPPEFTVLRHRPGRWGPEHSLAVEGIMSRDLTSYGRDLALLRAWSEGGEELYARVAPKEQTWGPSIVEDSAGVSVPEDPAESASRDLRPADPELGRLAESAMPPPGALAALDAVRSSRASNAWVVGGSRSESGKPLLANDPHLGLNHPSVWYLIGLHAPGIDVVGMSLPGVPGVVLGHTRGVAWGFTNAGVDDGDLFVERLDPQDSTRYLTPEGPRPFEVREERILVKGRDQPERLVVRETRHGPVVSDVEARAGERLLSYRWTANDPSNTTRALVAMNQASSVQELIPALADLENPHQSVVFADTSGAFGYWMTGTVPLRADGTPDILPQPAWDGNNDWIGALPFEEHPHVLDPERGYVVTANNRPSWDSVGRLITSDGWQPPYRAARIRELILARDRHDAESMARIQMDTRSALVDRYGDRVVAAFREAGLEAEADRLAAWDGFADVESREATLFFGWWAALRPEVSGLVYGRDSGYFPYSVLDRALDEDWPELRGLEAQAARTAAEASRGRVWGRVHRLDLVHPLGRIPIVSRVLGFGRRGIPRAGGRESVNVAGFSGATPPFRVTFGPSQRHVVDLADVDGSGGFILPGGQSGLPGHANSFDQLERWQRGELWVLPLERSAVEARTVRRLLLRPR